MYIRSFHLRGSLSSAGLGQALQHVPARDTIPLLGVWGHWCWAHLWCPSQKLFGHTMALPFPLVSLLCQPR